MSSEAPLSDVQLVEEIKARKERLNELATQLADMNIGYHQAR